MATNRRSIIIISVLFLAAIGIGIGIGAGIWKSDDGSVPVPPTTTDNPVTTTLMTTTENVTTTLMTTTDVSTAAVSTSKVTTTAEVTTTSNVITTAEVTTTAMDFSFDYNNPMLGQMRGLRDTQYTNVIKFLGLRYAETPIRFAAPVMKTYTDDIIDGSKAGLNCKGQQGESEDCLNLNIYLPEAALNDPKELFPVVLNIHGGAFFAGSNDDELLQGEYFAQEQNIILIQANYRLAAFGFWYLEDADENGYQTNWGLLDQRLAMEWTQKYIAGFGGDPNRVTITGCSAGGQSVIMHTTLEESWPYFQQASSFSGPLGMPFYNTTQASEVYGKATRGLGCLDEQNKTNMTCLRSKTTDEIWEATMGLPALLDNVIGDLIDKGIMTQIGEPYGPIIGDKVLPKHPYTMVKEGHLRPDTKITIESAQNEGEEFLEEVLFPMEDPILVNRESRVPLKFWEYLMWKHYGIVDGQKILDLYGCRERCEAETPNWNYESSRCDCTLETERWLTTWVWPCHLRSALQGQGFQDYKGQIFPINMKYYYPREWEVDPWDKNCYTNACHCVGGEFWLFGGSSRFGHQNETDLAFGKMYRGVYGEFFRTGNLPLLTPWSPNDELKQFNYINGSGISLESLFQPDCNLDDAIDKYLTV